MKSNKLLILVSLTTLVLGAGCKKTFENYNANKNLPTQVPPSRILPAIENGMQIYPGGDYDKYGQYIVSNYTYYGLNQYWSGNTGLEYGNLRNVLAMEKEANRLAGSDNNPYHALGLFSVLSSSPVCLKKLVICRCPKP